MDEPEIAGRSPSVVEVKAGKKYFWCACGKSKKQPFCDGAHKGTGFAPLLYDATKDGQVYFCDCKQSSRKPLCDGSHNKLD